jgi:LSD1 subclass zinc finger protein
MNTLQLQCNCPVCKTLLTYPNNAGIYIQCPSCQTTFSPPTATSHLLTNPQQQQQSQQQSQPQQQTLNIAPPPQPQSYVHCGGCQTLLSHPPSSVTIQCPKCLSIMDIPQAQQQSQAVLSRPMMNLAAAPTHDSKHLMNSSALRKKRKDPSAPKRASNAYMIFCKEKRAELKANRPDLPFGQLGKRLGEMWRSMTADEKRPYEDRASNDRDRYKVEMNTYQSNTMMKQVGATTVDDDTSAVVS